MLSTTRWMTFGSTSRTKLNSARCRHGCSRQRHLLLQRIRDLEAGLGFGSDFIEGHIRRKLDQSEAAAVLPVDDEDSEVGDHHVDDTGAGERQGAALEELRLAFG